MDIERICFEIAQKHASIIEEECKKVCERFNCPSTDLIIEYHDHTNIKIRVHGSDFTIDNIYTMNG
jgi:hypothetical protein